MGGGGGGACFLPLKEGPLEGIGGGGCSGEVDDVEMVGSSAGFFYRGI